MKILIATLIYISVILQFITLMLVYHYFGEGYSLISMLGMVVASFTTAVVYLNLKGRR